MPLLCADWLLVIMHVRSSIALLNHELLPMGCSATWSVSMSSRVLRLDRSEATRDPFPVQLFRACQAMAITGLVQDRKKVSFDTKVLTGFLHGGKEAAERRRFIFALVGDNPVFSHGVWQLCKLCSSEIVLKKLTMLIVDDRLFASRKEQYVASLAKDREVIELVRRHQLTGLEAKSLRDAVGQQLCMNGLHYIMFLPTLRSWALTCFSQGTDEQQERWVGQAENFEIIGTYAQTEMGHGSFVRGIETTATFDRETDEFVLHSPTLTATKWWPGSLGKTATHCITVARLIIDGEDKGPHPFFTPLRSLADHSSLKGVELGDIGPKFGYNTMDNGFCRFTHYRIPRDHLLSRYASVSRDGTYKKPVHAKANYLPMVQSRAKLVSRASVFLSKAVTIAVRYSLVRRQGFFRGEETTGLERQVMDYQMQQYRLLPLVASSYALTFAGRRLADACEETVKQIKQQNFRELDEMHAMAAGLKAVATWEAANGIEECRQACGGHGYLLASHLPEAQLFTRFVPNCTFEGDNYVLVQQTTRFLLKRMSDTKESLPASMAYLLHPASSIERDASWLSPETQLRILSQRAARLLRELRELLTEAEMNLPGPDAWTSLQSEMLPVARAHCELFLATSFYDALKEVADAKVRSVLERLAALFALKLVEKGMAECAAASNLDGGQQAAIRKCVRSLVADLRDDAVGLVDAFDFTDHSLGSSVLGRWDGRVYEAIYASALKDPLNSSDVTDGYRQSIRPVLHANRSRL